MFSRASRSLGPARTDQWKQTAIVMQKAISCKTRKTGYKLYNTGISYIWMVNRNLVKLF